MRLLDYRKSLRPKPNSEDAGQQLGVNGSTYNRWERGETIPSPENIRQIEQWSGGKVTATDIYETYWDYQEGVIAEQTDTRS